MLELREYKEDETQQIRDILIEEKINDLDLNKNILVVVEENIVLGICKFETKNSDSWLKYLIVKEDSRGEGLGEGLLRTLLNKLDLQGIKKIFYDGIDLYLMKRGFMKDSEGVLELNIREFFTAGCSCSGKSNEV